MANLLEIAEVAFKQLFPNPGDETKVSREQFISTARTEYAYQLWRKIKEDKREYGQGDIPSYLLSEAELDVVDNEMDISELKIMRSIDEELWLRDVGGAACECLYIKSTHNHTKMLCDEDSLPDDAKTFYPLGKKIKFPLGTHATKLKITYANNGENINDVEEVDDAIGGIVRTRLIEIYGGKIGKEDKTDNTNADQ